MNPKDTQRLLKGASLILQEVLRLQVPEVSTRLQSVQTHMSDVLHKLPQAIPNISAARSGALKTHETTQEPTAFAASYAEPQYASPPFPSASVNERDFASAQAAQPSVELIAEEPAASRVEPHRQQSIVSPSASHPGYGEAAAAAVRPPIGESISHAQQQQQRPVAAAETKVEVLKQPSQSIASPAAPVAAAPIVDSIPPRPTPLSAPAAPVLQSAASFSPSSIASSASSAAPSRAVGSSGGNRPQDVEEAESAHTVHTAEDITGLQPTAAARKKREFRERKVPASQLARVWGFGSMAASMLAGAAGEAIRNVVSSESASSARSSSSGDGGGVKPMLHISQAQAERLAEGLCRMRGAALKIGQMLSIADENMLPPAVAAALERVRTAADIMPRWQLEKMLSQELGPDWRAKLGGDNFDPEPIAAASIGQVHRATLPDGRRVAIKVQYPGVAESINSDLNNLRNLMTWGAFMPKGLYMDQVITVARDELTKECDYVREAEMQTRFKELVGDDPDFDVPSVVPELSTKRVLVTTWLEGVTIDQVVERGMPQAVRDRIARKLLKLTLKELFVWRFMQTDPNWGNFFYNPATDRIGLLDFGACREFDKGFVDQYLRLVWAAANNDRKTIEEVSIALGFLTGYESRIMLDAHVDSGLVVGEPFLKNEPFDFRTAGITSRVTRYGSVFAEHRLTPPPNEAYSLHRKLAGAFLICIRMGAVMRCRDLLEEVYHAHPWDSVPGGQGAGAIEATKKHAAAQLR